MATISVVIINYDSRQYIKEAIESVENQTYKDWELLIINDGDDDVSEFVPNNNYTYYHKTNDIGLSACRMYGVEHSYCDYILFLDADDKIHPEFLEKTLKVLEENPQHSFCYTDTQHFGDSNGFWEQPEYNFNALLQNNYICSCSLIRKKDLISCGGFDLDNFNYFEDYEFWIHMGSKGFYGKHLPEKLFYYRIHEESGMQSRRTQILGQYYKAYIISKHLELYPRDFANKAKEILSEYPDGFMKLKPSEQQKYLDENGIIG